MTSIWRFSRATLLGRLWILQELAMANSEALVAWGDEQLKWRDLCMAYQSIWPLADTVALRICEARGDLEFKRIHLHETIVHLKVIIDIQTDYNIRNRFPKLMRLLDLSRYTKASDVRDHIYGLAGLIQPDISKLIAPDYEATSSDMFRDFTLSVIEATGELDIIYQARRGNTLEDMDMPSWVTDWSQQPADYLTIQEPKNFQAAGNSKPIMEHSEDRNLLKCRGFLADFVDGHGCNCNEFRHHDNHDAAQPITLLQPYESVEAIKDALWNAVLGGRKEHNISEETYKLLLSIPWLSRLFLDRRLENTQLMLLDRLQQCNRSVYIAGQRLPAYFPELTADFDIPAEIAGGDPSVTHTFSDIVGRLMQRKLFTTYRGYIGMGPPNVQQSDRIYVLLGCNLPVVLRPCGDGMFKLVGEFYIHSIMNGEALEWLEKGDWGIKMETVTIC